LQKITIGQLRVSTYSDVYTFPIHEESSSAANATPNLKLRSNLKAEIRVVNDAFWVRLCAMGDLGFAEAYMYGEVECDDLVSLFEARLWSRRKYGQIFDRWVGVLEEQRKRLKYGLPCFLPAHTPTKNHVVPLPQYHWKLAVEHFRTL
jgi:hypothetical protein